MSFDREEAIDPDELGAVLKLFPDGATQMDMELNVELDGSDIEGEGFGTSGDKTLAISGYFWKAQMFGDDGYKVIPGSLWISRNLDVASASLTSALKACSGNAKKRMCVELKVFRAGGTNLVGIVAKPVICFKLSNARIAFQAFLTNSPTGLPTEVLAFSFETIQIETAPQMASGIIGAVRVCQLTW
jgi:type VI protein secretion system component Hcp